MFPNHPNLLPATYDSADLNDLMVDFGDAHSRFADATENLETHQEGVETEGIWGEAERLDQSEKTRSSSNITNRPIARKEDGESSAFANRCKFSTTPVLTHY